MVWYNSYSILYEFERAFGDFKTEYGDCWYNKRGDRMGWQEPSRRVMIAPTMPRLKNMSEEFDAAMGSVLWHCSMYLITITLSECWQLKNSGRMACASPLYSMKSTKSSGIDLCKFYNATKEDNLRNLEKICELIYTHRGPIPIVFGLCPVPLRATFTNLPLIQATKDGKRKIKWAMKQVAKKYDFVHYFNVYEICQKIPIKQRFNKDKRHIRPPVIKDVAKSFEHQFIKDKS
jgi:hypothetical protein